MDQYSRRAERKKKEPSENSGEKPVKKVSFYEDDDYIYEQVIGPGYAAYNKNTEEIVYVVNIEEEDFKLVPLDPLANDKGLVMLPKVAKHYGSEEELLDEIQQHIHNYVDISEDMERFASYYILLSWVYDRVHTVCYLRALGDTGSGKTRFLDTIGRLCYKATIVSGAATAAPVFRLLELWRGTMVIDEADFSKSDTHQDIVKLLNTGFEKGKPVIRCYKNDPDNIQVHDVYGPKILSSRYTYEDKALESRCLTERMMQTNRDLPVVLPEAFFETERKLRDKLLMYRFKNYHKIGMGTNPIILEGIEPRLRQATQSFTLLFEENPVMRKQFTEFMHKYQRDLVEERATSWEGLIVNAIHHLCEQGEEELTTTLITGRVNEGSLKKEELSTRKIGRIMKSLGLNTIVKKVGFQTKRVLDLDKKVLQILYTRYISGYKVTTVTSLGGTVEYLNNTCKGDKGVVNEGSTLPVGNVTVVTNVTGKVREYLENNDGRVVGHTAANIAQKCELDPTNVSDLLDNMVKSGDLIRGPNNLFILRRG